MNLDELIDLYRKDPRTQQIKDAIATPRVVVHLTGMVGSIESFIATAVFKTEGYFYFLLKIRKENPTKKRFLFQGRKLLFSQKTFQVLTVELANE